MVALFPDLGLRGRNESAYQSIARLGDVARLCPLKHRNLNVFGRYSFTASGPREGLRPLRDSDAVKLDDDDDDDDGGEDG